MRLATLPVDHGQPCGTGRGHLESSSLRWRHSRRSITAAAMYGGQRQQQQQQQPGPPAQQGPSGASARAARSVAGRTGAYSAALNYQSSSATEQVGEQQQQQQQGAAPAMEQSQQRDSNGVLRQRQRPLKINLDLALYRARQKRIVAFSSKNRHDRSRQLREVEEALKRCMEVFPEDGRPYVSLGKLYVQQRRYDEALALYEEGCTATGGTNAHIWAAWAYLAAKLNNVSLARKLYDAALVANPQHAAAWHGWGLLEKEQGNYLRARDLWLQGIKALRSSPNPYLYQSLAVLAAEMDCVEEARKWFKEGTRTLTGRASHALWQAWALMEKNQGDPTLVRPLLKRGLEGSPRSRYTLLTWALWEKEQNNVEEARRLFREGVKLNPRDPALMQAWALMEEEQGDIELARRLLRRASRVDPQHLYVWQAWGCMEYRQANYDQARELFQQGIWAAPPRSPSVALVFQAWAMLERDAGNTSLARELFKCAVKADPKSEASWLVWAQMEEDLGFLQRAAELRSYNMQERVEVVKPANFSTSGSGAASSSLLSPLFQQIAKWFQRYEEDGNRLEPELPDLLPLEVSAAAGDAGEQLPEGKPAPAAEPAKETLTAAAARP